MPSPAREWELNDRLWERVQPLLPPAPPHPKGGRPFADDRACFEGIVYLLRNGLRWRHMPGCYPSGVTRWRRHRAWTEAGVWDDAWKQVLAELAAAGRLGADELALDGTYVEAKTGASGSARAGSAKARPSNSSWTAGARPLGRRRMGRASMK